MTWLPHTLRGWAEFATAITVVIVAVVALLRWQGGSLAGPGERITIVEATVRDHILVSEVRMTVADSLITTLSNGINGLVRLNCIRSPTEAALAGLDCQ
jgi:hypothetical protein